MAFACGLTGLAEHAIFFLSLEVGGGRTRKNDFARIKGAHLLGSLQWCFLPFAGKF